MSQIDPLRLLQWILEHLEAGNGGDALTGDLAEEFRSGRSAMWYWRQVIGALLIGWLNAMRSHRLWGPLVDARAGMDTNCHGSVEISSHSVEYGTAGLAMV
jgi:hypothetical protein